MNSYDAISCLVSLALIWVLFFWFYKDYRLDRFRQNLFALRDELFDLAAGGKISFDSPAYGMLRSTINGNIQYGHFLTLADLIALLLVFPKRELTSSYRDRWEQALADLDEQTQLDLKRIKDRLHINVLEQVVLTSAVLMFSVVAAAVWIALSLVQKSVFERVRRFVNRGRIAELMLRLDSAAFAQMSHN